MLSDADSGIQTTLEILVMDLIIDDPAALDREISMMSPELMSPELGCKMNRLVHYFLPKLRPCLFILIG